MEQKFTVVDTGVLECTGSKGTVTLELKGSPAAVAALSNVLSLGLPALVGAAREVLSDVEDAITGEWDVTGDGEIILDDVREGFECMRRSLTSALILVSDDVTGQEERGDAL